MDNVIPIDIPAHRGLTPCEPYRHHLHLPEYFVTVNSKLAKIPFGSGGVKTKVTDYLFCGEFVLIGHKFQNIDQFLCQRGLYRPFVL